MQTENNKKDISELVEVLKELDRDELMQTYGFALGQKAKRDTELA